MSSAATALIEPCARERLPRERISYLSPIERNLFGFPDNQRIIKMIDFNILEGELENAIMLDENYKRENNAKFRAVEQRVATYDEFR